MPRDSDTRWQPPDRLAPGKKIVGWANDIIQDGEGWLESQPFWSDLSKVPQLRGPDSPEVRGNGDNVRVLR